MSKKVVIIGGVAGGASCAARLRRLDEQAEILVLERGQYISYANCGLPYYAGGVIASREELLLSDPETMRLKFNCEVRVGAEVTAIDREQKQLTVRTQAGETYQETYDKLVISTGSSPVIPNWPGVDDPRLMTLWNVPDSDRLKAIISEHQVQQAVVVGGGFVGIEVAENLNRLGIKVTIVEAQDQVLAPLDPEMALIVEHNLRQNGLTLRLGQSVSAFVPADDQVLVQLTTGETVVGQLVILSLGVQPNSQLAEAAGLAINERGGMVVDQYLRTSDPDIYAVGDVIEVTDFVFKNHTMIPLAGPANKQGRIAAANICGWQLAYQGTLGTAIVQVCDLTAASCGANEKALLKRGMVKGRDYESVIIIQNSHAGYYPGAESLMMKLLFSLDGQKLYGAQIVGVKGVDKRIDTIAVTMRLGGSVMDLTELELAYAPPYSSAKDPVNMLGFMAQNVLDGLVSFADWQVVEAHDEKTLLVDVRDPDEVAAFAIPGALNIPLWQLRERLGELPRHKQLVIFCAAGIRAYTGARILMQHGFEQVSIYPGGARFYQVTHADQAD